MSLCSVSVAINVFMLCVCSNQCSDYAADWKNGGWVFDNWKGTDDVLMTGVQIGSKSTGLHRPPLHREGAKRKPV
jgi:hypothetical protein